MVNRPISSGQIKSSATMAALLTAPRNSLHRAQIGAAMAYSYVFRMISGKMK
jgi:hypothetical protein